MQTWEHGARLPGPLVLICRFYTPGVTRTWSGKETLQHSILFLETWLGLLAQSSRGSFSPGCNGKSRVFSETPIASTGAAKS